MMIKKILRKIYFKLPVSFRSYIYRFRQIKSVQQGYSLKEFERNILKSYEKFKGVIIFEYSIDWNHNILFQRPQYLAKAFGKIGYIVIYRTLNSKYDNVKGFIQVDQNVWLTDEQYKLDKLDCALRIIYPNPVSNTFSIRTKKGTLVYEYIDHMSPDIWGNDLVSQLREFKEFAFQGGVDYIVTSAKELYTEAINRAGKERVLFVPNGVEVEHWAYPRKDINLPDDLVHFRQMYSHIVGYHGAIAPWLWYEVIDKITEIKRDIGFVFIGPDYIGGAKLLPRKENILYLGPINYNILPTYVSLFDVGFIPFKPGPIAQTTSPLKLYEYFALQKPVVVTSCMKECMQYGDVIFHGLSSQELISAIDKALEHKNDSFLMKKMFNLAIENDWIERARRYEYILKRL